MKSNEIMDIVSKNTGIPLGNILSSVRKREYVDARKLTAHFLRKHTTLTYHRIAGKMNITHANLLYY